MFTRPSSLCVLGLIALSIIAAMRASPLQQAIREGDRAKVVALLSQGAEVNAGDEFGTTPLHTAATVADREMVALLLACGANPEAKDNHGLTPLEHAVRFGDNQDTFELLADRAAALPPPPDAEADLQQGIEAARQGDYPKAIASLEKARTKAPGWPLPLYYLGLAESKLRGRELRAYCWFKAFLAVAPYSPTAAAIAQETDRLKERNRKGIQYLLKVANSAVDLLPEEDPAMPPDEMGSDTDHALRRLAGLWAQTGETEQAVRFAQPIRNPLLQNLTLSDVAHALVQAGSREGGRKVAAQAAASGSLILRSDDRAQALSLAAAVTAEAGDISGALTLAARIEDADQRSLALAAISWRQALAGEFAAASAIADSIPVSFRRGAAQTAIALRALETGNRQVATQLLPRAQASLAAAPHDENAVFSLGARPAPLRPKHARVLKEGQKTITLWEYPPRSPAKTLTVTEAENRMVDDYDFSEANRDCNIVSAVLGPLDRNRLAGYLLHPEVIYQIGELRARNGDVMGANAVLQLLDHPILRYSLREAELRAHLARGHLLAGDRVRARMELTWIRTLRKGPLPPQALAETTNGWIAANAYRLNDPTITGLSAQLRGLPTTYPREYFSALLDTIETQTQLRTTVLALPDIPLSP